MTTDKADETTAESGPVGLHSLWSAHGSRRPRKRIGRGQGSGSGTTAGRGQKGQKARAGSHYMRPGFEGGQMPIHMQLGKLRGSHKKMSMPMGPFRTTTQPVNLKQLAQFDAGAEVTPQTLLATRVLRSLRHPVKVLGVGELEVALTVHAHGFSASARRKIEAAGGTVVVIAGRNGADDEAAPSPGEAADTTTDEG